MAKHAAKVVRSGEGVRGVCSCKMKQPQVVKTKQEAEDWILGHEAQVRRARAGAEPVPTTSTVVKMYKANMENTTLAAKEREQWKQLYDEVATRMGLNAPPSEQLELF